MYGNSRGISTAQAGVHDKLEELVLKHRETEFRKPFASWNEEAYRAAMTDWDGKAPLLLDAGCGVGWSTVRLANLYPDHYVLGVDQSELRLARGKPETVPANVRFVRADLVDFWRLLARDGIHLARHYVLYPNPWPKIGQLSRRWPAHAVFPTLPRLGGVIEFRSNWRTYIEEAVCALRLLTGVDAPIETLDVADPLTPFERKYRDSGQTLYRLVQDFDRA
jgi:tRNA (guanine-N7-)-methyltransferase